MDKVAVATRTCVDIAASPEGSKILFREGAMAQMLRVHSLCNDPATNSEVLSSAAHVSGIPA